MQDHPFLHIYGEKTYGRWRLVCLDYSVRSEALTLMDATRMLEVTVHNYLRRRRPIAHSYHSIAPAGPRAPLPFWVKFYLHRALKYLSLVHDDRRIAKRVSLVTMSVMAADPFMDREFGGTPR